MNLRVPNTESIRGRLRPRSRWSSLRTWLLPASRLAFLAALGPGLVSGFADNDSAGITTYSVVGAQFGYGLMWALLASMLALAITQETGARLALATGKGLADLIRERFGVRWVAFAVLTMLVANLGTTVAEFAGIAAALSLFHVPVIMSAVVSAAGMMFLLGRGRFGAIQYAFLAGGVAISIAYAISAVLAKPDWGQAALFTVVPHVSLDQVYILAVVGTVGTTITPWGQAFIQSFCVDKGLRADDLTATRMDVTAGSLITNVVAGFIVVACAATLWAHGQTNITDASQAAQALEPFAGKSAEVLFAGGLLAASLLGLGTVPLTSTYFATEAFGWERGLGWRIRQAPAFYGLLAFFIGFAALFVMIPGLPLVQVIFLSAVLNGLLVPVILVFVMLMATDRRMLGNLASGRVLSTLGWAVTALVTVMSIALVVSQLIGGK
ncbi:MAG: Nramp family divalent metal transporter [Candidatus Dormiibacterota bacterium]